MEQLDIPKIRTLDLRKRGLGVRNGPGIQERAARLAREIQRAIPTFWEYPGKELKAGIQLNRLQRGIERWQKRRERDYVIGLLRRRSEF